MQSRRCPTKSCKNRMPQRDICCESCWQQLPHELRDAIETERRSCRLSGIEHSQELLELRDRALAFLTSLDSRLHVDARLSELGRKPSTRERYRFWWND
jgi:hypothetical protein